MSGMQLNEGNTGEDVEQTDEQQEQQVEQPIFHRPASSGVYATVANFECARIGFNDITQEYVLDLEARTETLQSIARKYSIHYCGTQWSNAGHPKSSYSGL